VSLDVLGFFSHVFLVFCVFVVFFWFLGFFVKSIDGVWVFSQRARLRRSVVGMYALNSGIFFWFFF